METDRPDAEMIILPNDNKADVSFKKDKVNIVPTGKISPGLKRDIGASVSLGDILVFMDDDSYVSKEYFSVLDKRDILGVKQAVGGPGVTPSESGFIQHVSGCFFSCKLVHFKC